MPVKIIPLNKQASGSFNNGEILENKPIGFPHEGGMVKPYSNLFYWAHAFSDVDSTIGEHPHKGFEILSFVLEGTIEHFDSKQNNWITLNKGDVQIIRAGSGISHAEKLNAGSHIFQIWFDPDIRKTITSPASYNDYRSESFPKTELDGITKTIIKGENAPLKMETEGVSIEKWRIEPGTYSIPLLSNTVISVYCLSNSFDIDGNSVNTDDFLIINDEKTLKISTALPIELFVIIVPSNITYPTYASQHN